MASNAKLLLAGWASFEVSLSYVCSSPEIAARHSTRTVSAGCSCAATLSFCTQNGETKHMGHRYTSCRAGPLCRFLSRYCLYVTAPTRSMASLGRLLTANGLGAFADVFAAEQVTLETISDLQESDLKGLGIPMGPRKKILKLFAADPHRPGGPAGSHGSPRHMALLQASGGDSSGCPREQRKEVRLLPQPPQGRVRNGRY